MASRQEILQIIKQIAKEKRINVNWNDPALMSVSFRQLGIDSLDLFDVVSTLEERLKIRFSDETLMNLTTLEQLLKAVEALTDGQMNSTK